MSTWHYMKNGAQAGPVTTDELRNLLSSRAIPANTLIWSQGMATWIPANTVSDFAGSIPQPVPAAPPVSSAAGIPPTPATGGGGSKVLIVIVCIVLGFFVLVGGCVATCAYYAHKKAREFSRATEKNPQMAAVSMLAALTPGVQVVSKNEATGKITLRNKNTGEEETLDLNSYSADGFAKAMEKFSKGIQAKASASNTIVTTTTTEETEDSTKPVEGQNSPSTNASTEDDSASTPKISPGRSAALNAALKKFPAYVPAYPGAQTNEVTQNSFAGVSIGVYDFTTKEKPEDVIDYYEKKITAAGFTVATKGTDTNDFGPTAQIVAARTDPEGTITVIAESRAHSVHGAVNFTHR